MQISGVNVFIDIGEISIIGKDGGVPLKECTIKESLEFPLPTCRLIFDADQTFLKEHPITDGSLVTIRIFSDDGEIDETYEFRVYNLKLETMNNYIRYTLTCNLDLYGFFMDATKYALWSNSSKVFYNVANSFKIPVQLDETFDTQLWVPSNHDLIHWLSNVCDYGYIDDLSCMIWAVRKNKVLLYKNLSNIIKQTPKESLKKLTPSSSNTPEDDKSIPYSAAIPKFYSGVENLEYRGYGGYDTYFDFTSYSSKKVSANKVIASSNMININKDLSKGLNPTQHAINVGNFHPNYYKAYMQNLRQLSTYSTYMTVLLQRWDHEIKLLDPIILEYAVSGTSPNAASDRRIDSLSNVYIIDTITTVINSGSISQGLQLMSQGYNTTQSTGTY